MSGGIGIDEVQAGRSGMNTNATDTGNPGSPMRRSDDMRTHARALAYFFAAGTTLVGVAILLPHSHRADEMALALLDAGAGSAALILFLAWRRLPRWAYQAMVALGTLLISAAILASRDGSSAFAAFYIWVGLYSYYFFTRAQAGAQVVFVAAAYALVLGSGPAGNALVARWLLTMGTMVVSGELMSRLVEQVRAHAAEITSRAEGLRLAERRTRAIIETANEGFVAADDRGRITAFNPSAEAIFGRAREDVLGRSLAELLVPARLREAFAQVLDELASTGSSTAVDRRAETVALRSDGQEFPIEVAVSALREGDRWTLNAFVHDISERKQAERQVAEHAEDIARIAAVARDLSGMTDAHAARPAICRAAQELVGAAVGILYEPDPKGRELVSTAVAGEAIEQIHLPFTGTPSGATAAFSSGQPLFVADLVDHPAVTQRLVERLGVVSALWQPVLSNGVPIGVLTLAWEERMPEVSERVSSLMALLAAEAAVAIDRADLLARLESVARTDDLTGLANRRAWDEQLPRELSRARRDAKQTCVAMIDLDCFKDYNDAHGHQGGDRLLKETAAQWRELLRPSDLLARYGGDEFVLLLPGCEAAAGLEVIGRLRACTPEGQTCSAGVAVWDGEESPDHLVSRADATLYDAKKTGRDRAIVAR